MIYEIPDPNQPIRQGDIFFPLPNTGINLEELPVLNPDGSGVTRKNWEEVLTDWVDDEPKPVALTLEKVWAIVASQDCDNLRSTDITLFVIEPLLRFEQERTTVEKWIDMITERKKERSKYFYLPADAKIGFDERMFITFQNIIKVPRVSLEQRLATHRKGRLVYVADEHYRESIAQFFRRYPYDEWYPLTPEEYRTYVQKKSPDVIPPFPWQETAADDR